MKTLMLIIFFLLLGGFFIISEEKIQMNSFDNIEKFFIEYGNWIGRLGGNGKIVSGYVVKMEWLPEGAQPEGG